jgi:hypothetical protein
MRTADGTALVAHVGPDHPLLPLEPGLPLMVEWDAEAARLLPSAGAIAPPGDRSGTPRAALARR